MKGRPIMYSWKRKLAIEPGFKLMEYCAHIHLEGVEQKNILRDEHCSDFYKTEIIL